MASGAHFGEIVIASRGEGGAKVARRGRLAQGGLSNVAGTYTTSRALSCVQSSPMTTRRNPPRSYSDHIFFASSHGRTHRPYERCRRAPSFPPSQPQRCGLSGSSYRRHYATCGRFTCKLTLPELVRLYRLTPARPPWPRYNICPTTSIAAGLVAADEKI